MRAEEGWGQPCMSNRHDMDNCRGGWVHWVSPEKALNPDCKLDSPEEVTSEVGFEGQRKELVMTRKAESQGNLSRGAGEDKG